jgi:predicted phosphodiesterase
LKTVVISDVHGNLVALDAAVRAIEEESYDRLVFLGDAAATGPEPHKTVARLKANNPVCVMGNTDEWLLNPVPRENPDADAKAIEEIDFWCEKQLTSSDKDFLRTFKPTARVGIGGDAVLLAYHGSPKSNRDGVSPVGTAQELEAVLIGKRATVMAGGHLHIQMLRRYQDSILINPGSVGLPFERNPSTGKVRIPPWCEFAVITVEGSKLDISFRRVPVNPSDVNKSIADSKMPHKEDFLETWTTMMGKLQVKNKLV